MPARYLIHNAVGEIEAKGSGQLDSFFHVSKDGENFIVNRPLEVFKNLPDAIYGVIVDDNNKLRYVFHRDTIDTHLINCFNVLHRSEGWVFSTLDP